VVDYKVVVGGGWSELYTPGALFAWWKRAQKEKKEVQLGVGPGGEC